MAHAKIGRKELLDKIDDKLTWILSERSRRREEFLREWTKPIPTWRAGVFRIRTEEDAMNEGGWGINAYWRAVDFGNYTEEKLKELRKLAEVAHGYVTLSQDEAGWLA